ncbi:MAG: hypothetical protein HYU42_16675 [Candidatus Rokubacteria bacterium]|nr:hypothetical protein [Candidatus Rokubacteria bacterium]
MSCSPSSIRSGPPRSPPDRCSAYTSPLEAGLAEKFCKLGRVRGPNLLVAVRQSLALQAATLPATVLPFKTRILLRDLLPRLEAFRR